MLSIPNIGGKQMALILGEEYENHNGRYRVITQSAVWVTILYLSGEKAGEYEKCSYQNQLRIWENLCNRYGGRDGIERYRRGQKLEKLHEHFKTIIHDFAVARGRGDTIILKALKVEIIHTYLERLSLVDVVLEKVKIDEEKDRVNDLLEQLIQGITPPSNTAHRETHCYKCHQELSSLLNYECRICGWLICPCGVCRCQYIGRSFL